MTPKLHLPDGLFFFLVPSRIAVSGLCKGGFTL